MQLNQNGNTICVYNVETSATLFTITCKDYRFTNKEIIIDALKMYFAENGIVVNEINLLYEFLDEFEINVKFNNDKEMTLSTRLIYNFIQ